MGFLFYSNYCTMGFLFYSILLCNGVSGEPAPLSYSRESQTLSEGVTLSQISSIFTLCLNFNGGNMYIVLCIGEVSCCIFNVSGQLFAVIHKTTIWPYDSPGKLYLPSSFGDRLWNLSLQARRAGEHLLPPNTNTAISADTGEDENMMRNRRWTFSGWAKLSHD